MCNGTAVWEELRTGFSLYIYKDSSICRSEMLLQEFSMEKLSKVIGESQLLACSYMLLLGGLVRILLVRKLLPACSATLVARAREVEPTYSDAQCAQQYLYTRVLRMPLESLSLYEKKLPSLYGLQRIN